MIEWQIKIEQPVNKIRESLELQKIKLTKEETCLVKHIVSALGPFTVATEFLCKRTFNVAQGEDTIQFVVSKLQKNNTLSQNLLSRLET